MKNLTISKKLAIIVSIISLLALVIGFFVLQYQKSHLIEEVQTQAVEELQNMSNNNIDAKLSVGISNAVSIANDGMIQQALLLNDRQIAIDALKNLSNSMKESTEFQNIKVHIHTKDNKSFLRAWKLDKYGDDLSSFRHSVVQVNQSKKKVNTFELGKAGLSIRSVMPIFHNNEHLGSLEFMQGLNSVAKIFDKEHKAFLLLMDKRVSNVDQFNAEQIYKTNYIISQKFLNKEFYKDAQLINMDALLKNKVYTTQKYLYTYMDIKDFRDQKLGIALLASPMSDVNAAVEDAQTIINTAMIMTVLLIIFILASVIISITNVVIKPLKEFNNGIKNLIDNNSQDTSMRINKKSNDELGEVADNFNLYLQSIEDGIKQDGKVIDEAIEIIHKAKEGFYTYEINKEQILLK